MTDHPRCAHVSPERLDELIALIVWQSTAAWNERLTSESCLGVADALRELKALREQHEKHREFIYAVNNGGHNQEFKTWAATLIREWRSPSSRWR